MKALALCIAAALSLSACASMNNGSTNPNSPTNQIVTQYPVETAMINIYTKQSTQKLMAKVDNQDIVADIKVTPKGTMVFDGKSAQGAEVNTITKSNNQLINQSVSINYFTLNPLVFRGYTDSSGEYSVATQTTTLPKLAKVGDSSPLLTENVYSDSSKRQHKGRYTQSWSLAQDSNNTALFCIDTSTNMLLNVDPEGTTTECYKINAKGDILASQLTINAPNETIKFTSQ